MCGLVGYISSRVDTEDAKRNVITAMNGAIAHRGPDGQGIWVEDSVALGHRRLSILDLSETADQPMHSSDGRHVIVFNGEIYNFEELRRELEVCGEHFTTSGDTEVLLKLLMREGAGAVKRLNGMFAFAWLDRRTAKLVVARDRYGIKPLYVVEQNGVLAFASEAKAFLHHPQLSLSLDQEGLAEYLTFMNFISGRTLFRNVKLFPAGHWAEIDIHAPALRPQRYWDFRFTGNSDSYDTDALADEIYASFTEAVRRQLVSDVGVSAYLSGGVDSGSITAVAAAKVQRLRTFTAHFDMAGATSAERAFDERAAAHLMADTFGTSHNEVEIGPNDFERVFAPLCKALDEPRVGQSYPNYIVSELARSKETVVLSGAGGDELFAGYPWRYYQGLPADGFQDWLDGYYGYWRRLAKTDAGLAGLMRDVPKDFDGRAVMESVFPKEAHSATRAPELLNWALYFEAKTFLEGILLVEDKVAMAHSLETRVPFLDNDLVDLAQRVPIQAKLKDIPGELSRRVAETAGRCLPSSDRRDDGKAILRHMMARLVPDEIVNRQKQGFSAPDGSWWAGRSYNFVEERLLDTSRRLHDIIDTAEVHAILEGHRRGTRSDGRHKIWALLNLAETLDNFAI